ncbi:hypothetical protein SH661x_003344 [Planctomicrobium sp. SH661]|uniref:hypothetical protein n=1 Tax=Planctomicrobium sp. SH661 TaxID=3448124 RepID=UPI003F5C87A1
MDDLDRQLLENNPSWQRVLQAYLELTAEPQQRTEPAAAGPRWSDRIVSMNDIEPDELSSIHGQLIALGWLKFQFEIGQTGLMYRVSSEGRTVFNRVLGRAAEPIQEDDRAADEAAA